MPPARKMDFDSFRQAAELYSAGMGEEWQIALIGRRGHDEIQISQVGQTPFPDKDIAAIHTIIGGSGVMPDREEIHIDPIEDEEIEDHLDLYDDVADIIDGYNGEEAGFEEASDRVDNILELILRDRDTFLDDLDEGVGDEDQSDVPQVKEIVEINVLGIKGKNPAFDLQGNDRDDKNHRPSDLVTTPLLDDHGLAFNKRWNLIICRCCKEGLPLRSVPEHLMATTLTRWDGEANGMRQTPTNHVQVPPMRSASVAAKIFIGNLAQSLIIGGYIHSKQNILDASSHADWVKHFKALPHTAVEGIRTFRGWVDDSGYALRNDAGFRKRVPGQKKRSTIRKCIVQTFSETYPHFFSVDTTQMPKEEEGFTPVNLALTPIDLLLLEKSRLLTQIPLLGSTATDRRALLPIFISSGIDGWLDQFDRSTLYNVLPRCPAAGKISTPESYTRLKRASFALFAEDMKLLTTIHHDVPRQITNATPGQRPRKPFTILTQMKSVKLYMRAEITLIWSLLELPTFQRQGLPDIPLFILGGDQMVAILNLRNNLIAAAEDISKATLALRALLNMLYYPKSTSAAYKSNIRAYPVLQFLIYQLITPEGTYSPIELIPPIIAKIQYCIRLHSLHCIDLKIGNPPCNRWESVSMDFCEEYLQDYGGYPFSTIRNWLHEFSVIVKNTPRPALVWWIGGDLLCFGQQVSFSSYKLELRKKFLELEQFVLQKILFGIYSVDELEDVFKISKLQDGGDEKRLGYGVIADTSTPGMDNAESTILFNAMFKRQDLELQLGQDSRIHFNKQLALSWITDVDIAMKQFFPICHNTIISGRGTEATALRPANNEIGRRNVIFDPEAGTGAYDTDYHKGQAITGAHKHILRHMPYEVFRILHILVRIVRPIEFFFICRAFTPVNKQAKVHDAYSNHVFATLGSAWNSTTISNSLNAWFQDVVGFPMGLRKNRHFSIALQRRYLDYGAPQSGSKHKPEQASLERTFHRLHGHEKEVGDAHYAREGQIGSSSVDERALSLELSRRWHKTLGFSTGYSELMPRDALEVMNYKGVQNMAVNGRKAKYMGALKIERKSKSKSSLSLHNSGVVRRPRRKRLAGRPTYRELDSDSGEEFSFGDLNNTTYDDDDDGDSEGEKLKKKGDVSSGSPAGQVKVKRELERKVLKGVKVEAAIAHLENSPPLNNSEAKPIRKSLSVTSEISQEVGQNRRSGRLSKEKV